MEYLITIIGNWLLQSVWPIVYNWLLLIVPIYKYIAYSFLIIFILSLSGIWSRITDLILNIGIVIFVSILGIWPIGTILSSGSVMIPKVGLIYILIQYILLIYYILFIAFTVDATFSLAKEGKKHSNIIQWAFNNLVDSSLDI